MDFNRFLTGIALVSLLVAVTGGQAFCGYETENVFLVIIDGLRSDEAFSYPNVSFDYHPYIPVLWSELRLLGALYPEVFTFNFTATMAAHTQMITGNPCNYPNYAPPGKYFCVRPDDPTLFEYFLDQTGTPPEMVFGITGKEHLVRLGYSMSPVFEREDGITVVHPADDSSDPAVWDMLLSAMDENHPALVFVNLKDVDEYGHTGVWDDYIHAICYADSLMGELWNRIESDPVYTGKTTLLITTDHGRHSKRPGCLGFRHHGGLCSGCRKTFLLAIGPDTPAGTTIREPVDQQDICHTVGELLGLDTPLSRGRILWDILGITDPPDPDGRKYYPQLIADGGWLCRAYIEDTGGEYRVCVDHSYDDGVTWLGKTVAATSPWELKPPILVYDGAELRVGWQEVVELERWDLFSRTSEDMGATWGPKEEVYRCHHEFSPLDLIKPSVHVIEHPMFLTGQSCGPVIMEAYNNGHILIHRPGGQPGIWNTDYAAEKTSYFVRDLSADFFNDTEITAVYSDLTEIYVTPDGQRKHNYEIQLIMGGVNGKDWIVPARVTDDTCSSIQPIVCAKDENEALLVWADDMEDGVLQLYSHKLNPETGALSKIQKLTASPFGAWQPAGIYDQLSGKYYIVWSDARFGENNIQFGIFSGISDWKKDTLENTEGYSQNPAITFDQVTGKKWVIWEEVSKPGEWSLKCARIPEDS